MIFNELEDWIINSEGINIRVVKGGDINNPNDIIAIIDSNPKVRISSRICNINNTITTDTDRGERIFGYQKYEGPDIWINGTLKTTLHRKNVYGRTWCDSFLSLLGFN